MWVAGHLTGGLGNRLFQHAAAVGLAEKRGERAVFFLPQCHQTSHGAFNAIFDLFPSTEIVETAAEWMVLREPHGMLYQYVDLPLEPCPVPLVVDGWRQTAKYFPREGIRLDFENVLGQKKIAELSSTIPRPANTWFLHVRLGDYKNLAHHQVNLDAYYTACITKIPRGDTLLLCSDEPDLCAPAFVSACSTLGLELLVNRRENEVETLFLMSLCLGGTIAANSTFSWWGAYFAHQNGSAHSFYPSKWGAGLPPPADLIPAWGTSVSV